MKRIVCMAQICAGEEHPVRRRVGAPHRGPPRPSGLAVAVELSLGERAEDDDALGVAGGDGGVGERDRRARAVAAAAERLGGEVRSPVPSAALSRTGSLRSMYETNPSTSAMVRPASSTALRIAMQASWNSVSGRPPRL